MACLNPCILCARTCVYRDAHMKCNVTELTEKYSLNESMKNETKDVLNDP